MSSVVQMSAESQDVIVRLVSWYTDKLDPIICHDYAAFKKAKSLAWSPSIEWGRLAVVDMSDIEKKIGYIVITQPKVH